MKKRSIILFVFLTAGFALHASAQQMWPLMEGTQEIQLSGSLDWDSSTGDRTELNLGYGYFLAEGIEVGPRISMLTDDDNDMLALDAYIEYHYPVADNLAPYAGFSLGLFNNDKGADSTAAGATISFGCKFFLVEDLALDLSFNHTQSTADVFVAEDSSDSHRSGVKVGLRFFY